MPCRDAEALGTRPVTCGVNPHASEAYPPSRAMEEVEVLVRDTGEDCERYQRLELPDGVE